MADFGPVQESSEPKAAAGGAAHKASAVGHAETPTNGPPSSTGAGGATGGGAPGDGGGATGGDGGAMSTTYAIDPAAQFFQQLSRDLDRQTYFYRRAGAAAAGVGVTGGLATGGALGAAAG